MSKKSHKAIQQFIDPKNRQALLENAGELTTLTDPYIHIEWHHNNISFAAQGGPHQNALGQPDPRTVENIEQFLVDTHQAERIGSGLLFFPEFNRATAALRNMFEVFPWLRHGHESHPPPNPQALPFQVGSHNGDMAAQVRSIHARRAGKLEAGDLHLFSY